MGLNKEIRQPAAQENIITSPLSELINRLAETALEETRALPWEKLTSTQEGRLALTFVEATRRAVKDPLNDWYHLLHHSPLGQVVERKEGENDSFGYDFVGEKILRLIVLKNELNLNVFSEETGWNQYLKVNGQESIYAVADPFDGSKSFRIRGACDQAVNITLLNPSGEILAAAIADLTSEQIIFTEKKGPVLLPRINYSRPLKDQVEEESRMIKVEGRNIPVAKAKIATLPRRRPAYQETALVKINPSFPQFSSLGAKTWMLLSCGNLDAAVDLLKGQPWYEAMALSIFIKAGGVVINQDGRSFNPKEILEMGITDLETGHLSNPSRYRFVAARTQELAEEIRKLVLLK